MMRLYTYIGRWWFSQPFAVHVAASGTMRCSSIIPWKWHVTQLHRRWFRLENGTVFVSTGRWYDISGSQWFQWWANFGNRSAPGGNTSDQLTSRAFGLRQVPLIMASVVAFQVCKITLQRMIITILITTLINLVLIYLVGYVNLSKSVQINSI